MTDDRVIEVEVTDEDLEKMKAEGVSESELPEVGIKRYRPAQHRFADKNKITILLDADVLEHFEKRAEENAGSRDAQINDELRSAMERDREPKPKDKLAA